MKINLSPEEFRDLSRQLRFLYIRELRSAGFTDDESEQISGISRATQWRFEIKIPEIDRISPLTHNESMDGDRLIHEAMARVEKEDSVPQRSITEKYISKLREATKRIAIAQVVEWKKVVESHSLRFVTNQEPLRTYLGEKIIFKIWA